MLYIFQMDELLIPNR